jgi:excisionase family DNA binding protein
MQVDAEFLTIREVANLLRISVRTVRNWMTTGELPQAITIGRRRLFRRVVRHTLWRSKADRGSCGRS